MPPSAFSLRCILSRAACETSPRQKARLSITGQRYPRLQFWQVTDAYFDDGLIPVSLPWQVDERPKAARHYGGEQRYF